MKRQLFLASITALSACLAGQALANAGMAPTPRASAAAKKPPEPLPPPVDINAATLDQLMTLPGIGRDEARRIVAGRPYLSKTDLVTRDVLPAGPYLSLKKRIVAIPDKATVAQLRTRQAAGGQAR